MLVIYRACSTGNPNKHRPLKGDKVDLVKYCFDSFVEAFKDVDHKLVCLLDKPTNRLRSVFKGHKIEETYYSDFTSGNIGSFHRQLDLAHESGECYLLVEDDYYFLSNSGEKIKQAVETFDFVTPYDHIGYYTEDTHDYPRDIKLVGNHHWGSILSTTLTFGGKPEPLHEEIDKIKSYGWADHPMWADVTNDYTLYAAIPTLATHMETEFLSPCTDYPFLQTS